MRILKGLLILVVFLGIVFVGGGFLLPSKWMVTRSTLIQTSTEKIYPLVANFKEWAQWSPWSSAKDPSLTYTYTGPETGVGAQQSWTSKKMGQGSMQLVTASPQKGITYTLNIDMGWSKSSLQGQIEFESAGEATKVTWTDHGDAGQSFTQRWLALAARLMLGHELEKGLSALKTKAEAK